MHPLIEQLTADEGLPQEAIRACLMDIEAVAPDLLSLVSKAAGGTLEQSEENPCFIGLHILAAARDQRLFAPLVQLLRRSSAEVDKLLGDAHTMTLPSILVSCFDGNADDLCALIRNPAVDEFTRDSLFRALAFLTWEGRIDPAATRDFIEQFGRDRPVPDDDFAWLSWSQVIELLGWHDLAPAVEQAYADGRIPSEHSDLKHFRDGLAEALAAAPDDTRRFAQEGVGYLIDPVDELKAFNFAPVANNPMTEAMDDNTHLASSRMDLAGSPGVPAHNPMRHVGRNDPCPCGSGKKYKKCCGMAA